MSSSLIITAGLDGEATFELTGVLIDQLHSDFSCKAHSGALVPGELGEPENLTKNLKEANTGIRVILLGGSHSARSLEFFGKQGHEVIDLTRLG